jgi:hypothetical protein
MPLTETAKITKWSPPTTDDMKELLGIVITMGLHPTPSITDFFNVFPRDEFLLLFLKLQFAQAEEQSQLSKEDLIVSLILLTERKMGSSPVLWEGG